MRPDSIYMVLMFACVITLGLVLLSVVNDMLRLIDRMGEMEDVLLSMPRDLPPELPYTEGHDDHESN